MWPPNRVGFPIFRPVELGGHKTLAEKLGGILGFFSGPSALVGLPGSGHLAVMLRTVELGRCAAPLLP